MTAVAAMVARVSWRVDREDVDGPDIVSYAERCDSAASITAPICNMVKQSVRIECWAESWSICHVK